MYSKAEDMMAGDTIIWSYGTGIAYGEIQEIVGKTMREDDMGEYEVIVIRGMFTSKEVNTVIYEMPSSCELIILRD